MVWAFVTLIAAIIGPFSTFTSLSFEMRLLYWGAVVGSSIVMGSVLRCVVLRVLGRDDVIADLCVAASMALLFGTLLWLVNVGVVFVDLQWSGMSLQYMIGVVFLISLGVAVFRAYLRAVRVDAVEAIARGARASDAPDTVHRPGPAVHETRVAALANTDPHVAADLPPPPVDSDAPAVGHDETPTFLRRLEPSLGTDLLRVSADDHYLRVQTTLGEMRVLMRLRDALDELADLPGFRIHRSHWVAQEAVLRVRQVARRHVVELRDGTELPVSQSYLPELRRAGIPFE